MTRCPFCLIIAGEEPAEGLYRVTGEEWVAFAPLNPVVEGHYLVVPCEHSETLMTLSPGSLYAAVDGIREMAEQLLSLKVCESFNVIQSNGAAATQTVPHVHFHIVPRTKDDGLLLPWSRALIAIHQEIPH